MIGGPGRDTQPFYATSARPDLAKDMGFIGGKMAVQHGPAQGADGIRAEIDRLAKIREAVGPDFWPVLGCWMSMAVDHATRLAHADHDHGTKWIEEVLPPDVGWCGGLSELFKISSQADARNKMAVPHGSSVYSYHFVITHQNSHFAKFLMIGRGPTGCSRCSRPCCRANGNGSWPTPGSTSTRSIRPRSGRR